MSENTLFFLCSLTYMRNIQKWVYYMRCHIFEEVDWEAQIHDIVSCFKKTFNLQMCWKDLNLPLWTGRFIWHLFQGKLRLNLRIKDLSISWMVNRFPEGCPVFGAVSRPSNSFIENLDWPHWWGQLLLDSIHVAASWFKFLTITTALLKIL